MKSLNILICCNNLAATGGATQVYAMNYELLKRGHDVEVYSPVLGIVSKKMINCISEDKISQEYDLLLIFHKDILEFITEKGVEGKKIFTMTGIGSQDVPETYDESKSFIDSLNNDVDLLVSTTEEIRRKRDSEIIVQGINCNRFRPISEIQKDNPRVLSMVRSEEANDIVKKSCELLSLEFVGWTEPSPYIEYSNKETTTFAVEKEINKADIVVGLGRIVLESLACGRQPIVFDDRIYQGNVGDGIVTPNNIDDLAIYNFSGRYSNKLFSVDDMVEELKKYDSSHSNFFRNYILENFNVIDSIDRYLLLGTL